MRVLLGLAVAGFGVGSFLILFASLFAFQNAYMSRRSVGFACLLACRLVGFDISWCILLARPILGAA